MNLTETGFVVDAPDIIDAVVKAAAVSPTKGSSFVSSAGILFEVQNGSVLVKATDMQTEYRGEVAALHVQGVPEAFRLPSSVLSGWMRRLPTGADSTVEFALRPDQAQAVITCGKSKANFTLIRDDSFASIDAFDANLVTPVPELAAKLNRVSWACGDKAPLEGVHFDGKNLVALSGYAMATVPAEIPLEKPITAPMSSILVALKGQGSTVSMGVEGVRLLLMPDTTDQYTTTVFAEEYPNYKLFVPNDSDLIWTEIDRQAFKDALDRILALASTDKEIGAVDIMIEGGEMLMEAYVSEYGRVEEQIPMVTGIDEEAPAIEMRFQPKFLASCTSAVIGSVIRIGWPHEPTKFIKIQDGTGFESVIVPMRLRRQP